MNKRLLLASLFQDQQRSSGQINRDSLRLRMNRLPLLIMQTSLDLKSLATKTHLNKIRLKTQKSIDMQPLTTKFKESNIVQKVLPTTDRLSNKAFLSMTVTQAFCRTLMGCSSAVLEIKRLTSLLW
jgi:hypothetical protein